MKGKEEEGQMLLLDPWAEKEQNRTNLQTMLPREKERERYYLLPGMGGRALRRKRRMMLNWSLAAGLFVSAILACLLYWMSK